MRVEAVLAEWRVEWAVTGTSGSRDPTVGKPARSDQERCMRRLAFGYGGSNAAVPRQWE
jgi:hypothetical protein